MGIGASRRSVLAGLVGLPVALAAAATVGTSLVQAQQPPKPVGLTLVSYAVTKDSYDKIFKLFAADWKKKTGQTVTFRGSYGGSGSPTPPVIDGLEADICLLYTTDVAEQ